MDNRKHRGIQEDDTVVSVELYGESRDNMDGLVDELNVITRHLEDSGFVVLNDPTTHRNNRVTVELSPSAIIDVRTTMWLILEVASKDTDGVHINVEITAKEVEVRLHRGNFKLV